MADVVNYQTPQKAASGLKFIYRALQYRNYRLFFIGQLISLVGSWLTIVSTAWVVYELAKPQGEKHAALMLGVVNFASQIPIFLLASFGGVLADRMNRHRTLLVTQTLSMMQSFALAYLALTHQITILQIIGLNMFQGVVNALDVPTRQAFIVEMVENREDLSNAIALNSSMVHGARVVGPAIAATLIYFVGAGYCFFFDGFSYLAVLIALLAMTLKPFVRIVHKTNVLNSLKEGVRYAIDFIPIRTILLLVAATSFIAVSQSTLMPIFADKILGSHVVAHGTARIYGLLLCSSGVGAFIGSIYLASRRSVVGLGRVIALANASLGASMIAFSLSRSLVLSLPLLVIMGGSIVVQMAASNTVLQTVVDDDKRGRVMSLFAMCFMGMSPFGALLAGTIASHIGAPHTLTIMGSVCLVGTAVFAMKLPALRPLVRPIYIKKGILPQIATAMQQTASMTTGADE